MPLYPHQDTLSSSKVFEDSGFPSVSSIHSSLSSTTTTTTHFTDLQPSPSTLQGIGSTDVFVQFSGGLLYMTSSISTPLLPTRELSHTLSARDELHPDFSSTYNTSITWPSSVVHDNRSSWNTQDTLTERITTEAFAENSDVIFNVSYSVPETKLPNISSSSPSILIPVPIDTALGVSGSAVLDQTLPPLMISQPVSSLGASVSWSSGELLVKQSGVLTSLIASTHYDDYSVEFTNPNSRNTNSTPWINSELTIMSTLTVVIRCKIVSSLIVDFPLIILLSPQVLMLALVLQIFRHPYHRVMFSPVVFLVYLFPVMSPSCCRHLHQCLLLRRC